MWIPRASKEKSSLNLTECYRKLQLIFAAEELHRSSDRCCGHRTPQILGLQNIEGYSIVDTHKPVKMPRTRKV